MAVETDPTPPAKPLEPLPYHRAVVDYLKTREPELWGWFASTQAQSDHADALRGDLLKSTYRLDAAAHPELYAHAREACARLALDLPVTLYQSTAQTGELNAAIFYLPGEAHIVLCGPLLTLLDGVETQSVLGHELAHHHLWTREDGDFLVADRLIVAQASDPRADASHLQTARRYRLYTEVFADRGALRSTGDLTATVGALVKVQTGLATASGASYLRQADEIFARADARTAEVSHPEAFIRARALRLWSEDDPDLDASVVAMLEGPAALDELDLTGQARLSELTRRWLGQLLRPLWFQTPAVLAHARAFFDDFQPATEPDETLPADLRSNDPKTREYLSFLLLDFAVADRELEDLPLALAWEWSRRLEIDAIFDKLVTKELKLKAREWNKLKKDAPKMLATLEPVP